GTGSASRSLDAPATAAIAASRSPRSRSPASACSASSRGADPLRGGALRRRSVARRTFAPSRRRDRLYPDPGRALLAGDADLLRGRRRQIDDATLRVRPAVLDRHGRALPGLQIRDARLGPERQRYTPRVVVVGRHARAVRHLAADEAVRVDRRDADAL